VESPAFLHSGAGLIDPQGRRFSYLRLSITDACNFKCGYCLPNGYCREDAREPELSVDEIARLVAGLAELGMYKVRLTGGEPTTRRDFLEIVERVAATPGVREVAVSTNGYRLRALAPDLARLGVKAVNVSVDSLDRARFAAITGSDRLQEVLAGIDACLSTGIPKVKANAVLLRGQNDDELDAFLAWVRERPITARFIELMRTGENGAYFAARHVTASALRARLLAEGWAPAARGKAAGPAEELSHPAFAGRIGFITPYSGKFCESCNRLRVTARGELRLCLFGEGSHGLRRWLRDDDSRPKLQSELRRLLVAKEASHFLEEGRVGDMRSFSSVGG
jgi:cyclic pyranopterin phosphate synthase